MVALVDDNEAVHARLADYVEDAVQPIIEETGVDTRELLHVHVNHTLLQKARSAIYMFGLSGRRRLINQEWG